MSDRNSRSTKPPRGPVRRGRGSGPVEDAPGVPTRRAALRMLDAVLRRGESLDQAQGMAVRGLAPPDKALAMAIALQVLRRLPDLDTLIDGAMERPLPDDAKARTVLRMALAQSLILGTPGHAAISTVLPLLDGGPRKLAHGVFGALFRGEARLPDVPSLPIEVAERWQAQWGADMALAAAHALAIRPPLDLSLRNAGETESWALRLGGLSLAPGHVRLPADHALLTELPGFAEGAWWVQDIAATLPGRLLGRGDGRAALDLCAAPGGKTMQLAAAGWTVSAVDSSEKRLGRMGDNLSRTGLAADLVRGDLRSWSPPAPVPAVLLDAPCSATGIFRRHPDVLHRVGPRQIEEMAALQAQLLARAADWVAPGGRLIYATCSLERAEGEDQVAAFLSERSDFVIEPPQPGELPAGIAPTDAGHVRTLPGMLADAGGLDGFFIARLRRAEG